MENANDNRFGPLELLKRGLHVGTFLVRAVRVPHALFFTKPGSFGRRYLDGAGIAGALLFVLVMAVIVPPSSKALPIYVYSAALLAAFGMHRLVAFIRRKRGDAIHPLYIGDSLVSAVLPRLDAKTCREMEWPAALVISAVVIGICPTVAACIARSGTANALMIALAHENTERDIPRSFNASQWNEAAAAQVREALQAN